MGSSMMYVWVLRALTLKIVSSIGELLLLIYKSGFYRWEQKQPSKDKHDSYSNQIHKPHRSSRG